MNSFHYLHGALRHTHGKAFRAGWLLLCLVLIPWPAPSMEAFSAPQIRAVYLYNFAIFVRWPETAFESPSNDFRFCVLGDDQLRRILASVIAGETLGQRKMTLIDKPHPEQLARCHILYVADARSPALSSGLARLGNLPVLTVGPDQRFAEQKGIIGLPHEGRRIRPVVNHGAAQLAGLKLSSKLLRLSRLIGKTEN